MISFIMFFFSGLHASRDLVLCNKDLVVEVTAWMHTDLRKVVDVALTSLLSLGYHNMVSEVGSQQRH